MADYGRDKGLFIPTTQVWDTSEIYSTKGISEDLRELLVRMYLNLNNMAMAVNYKDTGIYHTDEFVCGQTFFPNPTYDSSSTTTPKLRQVWRKVFRWQDAVTGADRALPNTNTQTQPHGIVLTSDLFFTRIYGTSFNPVGQQWIPLPFVSPGALGGAIELWVDGANIKIITGSDRTAFTKTVIVLEYIKT